MIKGVLFDKDGTLIEFHALWLRAAYIVMPLLLEQNGLDPEIYLEPFLNAIGIVDGQLKEDGALAYKSYHGIAEDICEVFQVLEIPKDVKVMEEQLSNLFFKTVVGNEIEYEPIGNLKHIFQELKRNEIHIGIATADTEASTKQCLLSLGVLPFFEFIGSDNGVMKPKPAHDMFRAFQELYGLQANEIAVVGDTKNDMRFAKDNGGFAIGVLSGVGKREELEVVADIVLRDITALPDYLEEERRKSHGENPIETCI